MLLKCITIQIVEKVLKYMYVQTYTQTDKQSDHFQALGLSVYDHGMVQQTLLTSLVEVLCKEYTLFCDNFKAACKNCMSMPEINEKIGNWS